MFYVQFIFLVKIGCVLVVGVFGDVVFVGQEWAYTAKLKDTLAAVHDGKFILTH